MRSWESRVYTCVLCDNFTASEDEVAASGHCAQLIGVGLGASLGQCRRSGYLQLPQRACSGFKIQRPPKRAESRRT